MSQIVEVDEQGTIHLPRELLGDTPLPAHYLVEAQGDLLTLRRVHVTAAQVDDARSAWLNRTPAERAAAIHAWIASHTHGPGLPDEAVRRESMYD